MLSSCQLLFWVLVKKTPLNSLFQTDWSKNKLVEAWLKTVFTIVDFNWVCKEFLSGFQLLLRTSKERRFNPNVNWLEWGYQFSPVVDYEQSSLLYCFELHFNDGEISYLSCCHWRWVWLTRAVPLVPNSPNLGHVDDNHNNIIWHYDKALLPWKILWSLVGMWSLVPLP